MHVMRIIPNLTGSTSYKLKMRGKRTHKCNCPLSISPFLAYIEGIKILNLMKKRERFLLLCVCVIFFIPYPRNMKNTGAFQGGRSSFIRLATIFCVARYILA